LNDGLARLRSAVTEARAAAPDQLVEHVMAALLPGGAHTDDVAVVVYRHESPESAFAATVRDAGELRTFRRALGHWLLERGVGEETTTDLLVAACEACANSLEHGYQFAPSRSVHVSSSLDDDGVVRVLVRDAGSWKASAGSSHHRGRGIPLMRGLMDDVDIDTDPHGTTVRLTKRLDGVR
jgi:anti-sigma regulatory factor (Ser/Thr protein kinase)